MSGDGIIQILIAGIAIIIVVLVCVLAYIYVKDKIKEKSENIEISPETKKEDKSDKKSVFRFMEFDSIEDNMIIQDGGSRYLMVIECKGINYDLLSGIEKTSVEQGFLQFLNTLKYEIQIYIQTRKVNLNQSILAYKERVEKIKESLRYEEAKLEDMQRIGGSTRAEILKQIKEVTKKRNLYDYAQDLIQTTEQMSEDKDITTKQYYIVIPYYTEEITSAGDYDKREIGTMAFSELYTRAQSLANGLSECDVRGRILTSQELIELLYVAYNREQHDIYDFDEYLSESCYQSLYSVSEDILDKRMKAIDEEIEKKANQKAIYAFEMASDEVRRRKAVIDEREKRIKEQINKRADELVNEQEGIMGSELTKMTKENLKKMTERDKKEEEKVDAEKKKVRKLTEEERKRRLAIRKRKLMKEREKNGIIQKENSTGSKSSKQD
ncbi:putative uncharacterized protein [Clostridium sp. CAG:492]|nr:putative uncharacterized protein [Clostridium sp. CAG:492]